MSAAPTKLAGSPGTATRKTTIALVGRPNSGKSSLYNRITGGNARVGNYPGITIDVLEAEVELPSGARAVIADLPGLYSVEATVARDTDEGVARLRERVGVPEPCRDHVHRHAGLEEEGGVEVAWVVEADHRQRRGARFEGGGVVLALQLGH